MPEDLGGVHSILVDPGVGGTSVGGSGWWSEDDSCDGLPYEGSSFAGSANWVCVGESLSAEALPIDLYVVVDRSSNMSLDIAGNPPDATGDSRWDGVRAGLEEFVTNGEVGGVRIGLHFFGQDPLGREEVNCDPTSYSNPTVPIGVLSEVAPEILAALDQAGTQLGGPTPTLPALQGALDYVEPIQASNYSLGEVLLVTGGLPDQCGGSDSPEHLAAVARAFVEQGVRTCVVGLGPGLEDLHRVAEAGGTVAAYLIEAEDIAAQLRDALLRMVAPEFIMSCDIAVPLPADPTQEMDPDQAEFVIYPYHAEPVEIPRVSDPEACDDAPNGGWYYEPEPYPGRVLLCPCSCSRTDLDMLEVRFGCEPRVYQ